MNQSLAAGKENFVKQLNAHYKPRTGVDIDIFLADVFDHLGITTGRELVELAYIIIDKHKSSVWPSVAHMKEYRYQATAKRVKGFIFEEATPQYRAWEKYYEASGSNAFRLKFMRTHRRCSTLTEWPPQAPEGAA